MNQYIIVSRHPAAVEFIRTECPEFKDAPVLESAIPDDVRGKVVAGNLPLHLACLASQVVAVEFAGAPPRGQEYGIAEMRAAGAKIARYTVAAAAPPQAELKWNDGIGNRGRRSKLLVGKGDQIFEFTGKSIEGVLAVASSRYNKNGKWSSTTYQLKLAPGAWTHTETQSWEEGEWFHGHRQSVADVVAYLRTSGCTATDAVVVAFLEVTFPETVKSVRATEASLRSVMG